MALSAEELDELAFCTFLTPGEILHVLKRFVALVPGGGGDRFSRVPHTTIENIPEFRQNPFASRICAVFSGPNTNSLTFEDFLDCISVFSDGATHAIKAEYAFRIFDFNGDGRLDIDDLSTALQRMCELPADKATEAAHQILVENSGRPLNRSDFIHVASSAPNFAATFCIRLQ
eukprot:m.20458 g.20458  ORF g.20458 m.20458 type:complete len:174 (+) comp7841_c0_seq1:222-743(+)